VMDDQARAERLPLDMIALRALSGAMQDLAATVIKRVPPTTDNPLERAMIEAAHKLSKLAQLLATIDRPREATGADHGPTSSGSEKSSTSMKAGSAQPMP